MFCLPEKRRDTEIERENKSVKRKKQTWKGNAT